MIGSKRIETTTRVVWTIPLPCYNGDVMAVMRCINAEMGENTRLSDDAYKIEADETEIRFFYTADINGYPA